MYVRRILEGFRAAYELNFQHGQQVWRNLISYFGLLRQKPDRFIAIILLTKELITFNLKRNIKSYSQTI